MRITRRRSAALFAAAVLLALPFAAWALWKPIRVLAPEFAGVACYAGNVCTDDPTKVAEALSLRHEAIEFVNRRAGSFKASPRMVFCTMPRCDRSFGFSGNAAYNVGSAGIVVSGRGWHSYYVRHELIHCVQVERIGGFRMLFHTPTWLVEGMAYSMSEDPRRPLGEPWESYRRKYEVWAAEAPPEMLWQRASAL